MPNIDLSILNQRQTPAFFADTLANRPAAGFLGRIFVSTDTFAFYRDNGTGWDLIGGPGTGTITGSGTNGTIPLWSGASTIGNSILTQSASTIELKATGTNDAEISIDTTTGNFSRILFQNNNATKAIAYYREDIKQLTYGTYVAGGSVEIETDNNVTAAVFDSSQNTLLYGSLGVGTLIPGAAVDVHSGVNVIQQLNQTIATNNSLLAFQNSGTGLWRIGNFYNSGANDWAIFDVVGGIEPFSIKKTTGQTFIGAQTTTSGRLVVNNATGDNHIVVIGATAPSLRINNSGSGATKQIGIGLATATNNFIQGAVDRDMAIFNGSTTPSPILFGIYGTTNIQEAARISAARNFLVGTTTDSGTYGKIQVAGGIKIVNDNNAKLEIGRYSVGAPNSYIKLGPSSDSLRITDNNDIFDLLYLTNSGILGLGINPNTWSLGTIQQIGGTSAFWNFSGSTYLTNNRYFNSGNKYIANGFSTSYEQDSSGNHTWLVAPSGIANATIFSTTAMQLVNSGNLLLGTGGVDSGYKLQVSGSSQATRFTSSETQVLVSATPTVVFNSGGGSGVWIVTIVVTGNPGQIAFAIVGQRFGGTLYLLSSGVGTQIVLSVSGNTLLASQTAGGSILTSVSNMLLNQGG